jgi:SAM-dependent methyltransferase
VTPRLSPRLAALVDALPVRPDSRVLEVGCGPGAAARAVAERLTSGHVLAVDRSAVAVEQAVRASTGRPDDGRLTFRHVAAEDLALEPGEPAYDLVFAFRVGALDGRHPAVGARVLERLVAVTTPDARLYVDGGDPLREVALPR